MKSIGAAAAVISAIILVVVLYRTSQVAREISDSAVGTRQPAEQLDAPYAGPAAFSFTLENAALSPDGQVSAWSFAGNDVVMCRGVWNQAAPDLSEQISLTGHTAPIRALAFSSLGRTLASASVDRTVRLWDVASGKPMVVLQGHTDEVTAVAFTPRGTAVATGSRDKSIRLWDSSSGLPLKVLRGHTDTVRALAYSSSGLVLASASDDNSIKIWNIETGQEIGTFAVGEQRPILAMIFSPTQPVLATSDGGNAVRLWECQEGRELSPLELAGCDVLSAAFSPDGTAMALAGVDGRIIVQNLASGAMLANFVAPSTPLLMKYSIDGTLLWSRFSAEHLSQIGATNLVGRISIARETRQNAIPGFRTPDGVKMELFADESMVSNPAAICIDERGRLFVAETFRFDTEVELGYAGRQIWLLDDLASQTPADRLAMYEKHKNATRGGMQAHRKYSERIRRLEDSDGDGKADRVTIFAEGFNEPLTGVGGGLIARDGDLYYTCIPDLWKLNDTDDDGTADRRHAIHTGFGVKASLPHGLHGLAWGPDGKLYFSIGDRGYHVFTPDGNTLHNPATGAVLRCNADGSELEEVARGLRNPQELAFDQFGNLFTCDNNSNQGDQARLVHVVPGGDCGWHMSYETMPPDYPLGPWNMDRMWETPGAGQAAWILPPVAHLGTGPAGLAFNPVQSRAETSGGMPNRYEGHFFLCDFADAPEVSGLRSFAVTQSGAGFAIRDEHTFVSNILPTDVEFGFDQKMYISDWIRGATSDGKGRIYTASFPQHIDTAEVQRTAALLASGFQDLALSDLVNLLRHADMRVRQRAQFTLAGHGSSAIEPLVAVASQSDDLLARLHAIWALGMIARQASMALDPVVNLLNDVDPEIRAQAAKVLGEGRHQAAVDKLIGKLKDESLRVRCFACSSLGQLQHRPAVGPIVEMLRENNDQDVFLRHAGVYALFKIGDAEAVAAFADDDDPSVRLAVLLAFRHFRDERVAKFLNDSQESLVIEAARAIYDLPIEAAVDDLASLIARGGHSEPLLRRVIHANYRVGQTQQARALTSFVANAESSAKMKAEAIRSLGDWIAPPPRDRVTGFVGPSAERNGEAIDTVIGPWVSRILQEPEAEFQLQALFAAANLGLDVGDATWVTDTRRDIQVRTQLLNMMDGRNDEQLGAVVEAAMESDEPLLQIHAARLLAGWDEARAIETLGRIVTEGAMAEKQAALIALGSLRSARVDRLLSGWLAKLQAGSVPPPLKLEIMSVTNGRRSAVVQKEFSSLMRFLEQQPSIAGRYQAVLEGGSIERGRSLFEHHTGIQCQRCHLVNAKGGKVGPDLSNIGAKVSREYLLESLLAPELKIADGFQGVVIATTDGRVLTGTLQEENEQELRIINLNGESLVIDKTEIDERRGGKSVMPGDLLQRISLSDLRDLVEFLASLK